MKLGLVINEYFPFGGATRDCLAIAKLAVGRGHQVTVFSRTWPKEAPDHDLYQTVILNVPGWTNVAKERSFIRAWHQAAQERALDGIVGFKAMPRLDALFAVDPCFAAKADRLKPFWYRWTSRYRHYAAMEQAVYGGRTHVLLLHPGEIEVFKKRFNTDPDRLHVLPPGIKRRSLTYAKRLSICKTTRSVNGLSDDEIVLLLVGSGFRTKGLDRVIQGVGSLSHELQRRLTLIVIGDDNPGPYQRQARRMAIGDRLRFLGGRNDVWEFMCAADLLVHPAYSENTGTVLIEALTAGLPVLTNDVCGFAYHIRDANAGTVLGSPFDQAKFNAALEAMIVSDEKSTLGTNGIRYAESQDLYSCHQRAIENIEKIIGQKKSD